MSQADAETEPLARKRPVSGVLVRLGSHKLTVPVATVLVAVCSAVGFSWRIVANDRAEALARIGALEQKCQDFAARVGTQDVVLSDIRAQLARIDARVAEIQVTLMRGRP